MREINRLTVPIFTIHNGLSGQAFHGDLTVPSRYGYPTVTVREIRAGAALAEVKRTETMFLFYFSGK